MYSILAAAFHVLIPISIGAMGVGVILFGRYRDRVTGRVRTPRCPKCWYELVGVAGADPCRCPECGSIAGVDELHRCRAHRAVMYAGVGVLVFSATTAPMLTFDVAQEPSWLLAGRRLSASGVVNTYVNEELRVRHEAGGLSARVRATLLADSFAGLERAVAGGLPANPDEWPGEARFHLAWVGRLAPPGSPDDPVARWLADSDLSWQRAGLETMRFHSSLRATSQSFPTEWQDAYQRVLEADGHEGWDVVPVLTSGVGHGLPATPSMVDALLSRAANRERPSPVRRLALAAVESAATRGHLDFAGRLDRLQQLLVDPDAMIRANALMIVWIVGPSARPLLPTIRALRRDENEHVQAWSRRAETAVEAPPPK